MAQKKNICTVMHNAYTYTYACTIVRVALFIALLHLIVQY